MSKTERTLPHNDVYGAAAENLSREWGRRIGRHSGAPEDELPHFRAAVEDVGISLDVLDHDPVERRLTIEYSLPPAIDTERVIELLVTALLATHDSGEWADGGVRATDGTHRWEVKQQWLRRWRPPKVVQRVAATVHERQT